VIPGRIASVREAPDPSRPNHWQANKRANNFDKTTVDPRIKHSDIEHLGALATTNAQPPPNDYTRTISCVTQTPQPGGSAGTG